MNLNRCERCGSFFASILIKHLFLSVYKSFCCGIFSVSHCEIQKPQCGIHISHCEIQIPHCGTENMQGDFKKYLPGASINSAGKSIR